MIICAIRQNKFEIKKQACFPELLHFKLTEYEGIRFSNALNSNLPENLLLTFTSKEF